VYYSSNDRGPYTDLEAAVADVPAGGTLQLDAERYAYGEEGRIAPDRAITVRGTGWSHTGKWFQKLSNRGRDGKRVLKGTELIDVDNESTDPLIDFSQSPGGHRPHVHDLAVIGSRNASTTVRFAGDFVRPTMMDCFVSGLSNERSALRFEGNAYFARIHRNYVQGGVMCTSRGYAHEFVANHFQGNFECRTSRAFIRGGQLSGNPPLRLFHDGGYGGNDAIVMEPGIEGTNDPAIEIDGIDSANPYSGATIMATRFSGNGTGVRFGNAENCRLIHCRTDANTMAEWSENAVHCGIIATPGHLSGRTLTDHGARNPWVSIAGSLTQDQLASLPTEIPTYVQHSVYHGGPLTINDGEAKTYTPQSVSIPDPEPAVSIASGSPDRIDGDLSDFPSETRLVLGQDTALLNNRGTYGKDERLAAMEPDIDGEVQLAWDDDALYFGALVNDDTHVNNLSTDNSQYRDSVQLAVAPIRSTDTFYRITVALQSGEETVYFDGELPDGVEEGLQSSVERSVIRNDGAGETIYEFEFPWTLTGVDPADRELLLAFVITDADNEDDVAGWQSFGTEPLNYIRNVKYFEYVDLSD
jgi:hypothetical protein